MFDIGQKVAVIDIGSNTTKALIVRVEREKIIQEVASKSLPCRLIDSGASEIINFSKAQQDLVLSTLKELFAFCARYHVFKTVLVATEAFRKSTNSAKVRSEIECQIGQEILILSGKEEAKYIFHGLTLDPLVASVSSMQAFDLGGGSLEVMHRNLDELSFAESLPLGALKISGKFFTSIDLPLEKAQVSSARNMLNEAFKYAGLSTQKEASLIGLGGAVFFLRKILNREAGISFDERCRLDFHKIQELFERSASLTTEDRLKSFPDLPGNRADIFPVASLIIAELMKFLKQDTLIHSFFNLRFGVAACLVSKPELFNVSGQ